MFVAAVALLCAVVAHAGPVASGLGVMVHRPDAGSWRRTQCGAAKGTADIPSRWGAEVRASETPLKAYPRPQLVRGAAASVQALRDEGDAATWANLNGLWEWERASSGPPPFGRTLAGSILVPFPVESCLSGVAPQTSGDIVMAMWYRLTFDDPRGGARTLLHFGAVDWQASVYLNTALLGNHTGGYDGFSFDVTDLLVAQGNELLVYVWDPSDTGAQPNGKQRISAIDKPGGDTYTPNSGIWQTVWLERVPSKYIRALKIDQASLSEVSVTADVVGGGSVQFAVMDGGMNVASSSGDAGVPVTIAVPSPKPWSPGSPTLYDLKVTAGNDSVLTYFGLRTFTLSQGQHTVPAGPYTHGVDLRGSDIAPCGSDGCPLGTNATSEDCEAKCNATAGCLAYVWSPAACGQRCWLKGSIPEGKPRKCRDSRVMGYVGGARPLLNSQYTFLAGFLDQSWWPDGQYTAPSDTALEFDLIATKKFGLNMIRLHQKVNPERWYYHADRHGLVIFQDMPQKYGGATDATVPFFVRDLQAMILGRGNHPCIVQWTTFNEGDCWDVFKKEPYDVLGITRLAKQLDPTRLVDANSGGGANDYHYADVNDIHSYPYPGDPKPVGAQYAMVGEFGGIGAFISGKEWTPGGCHTYLHVNTSADEADKYVEMAKTLESRVGHISASVYTQTTDVELECDGFLNYDRTNKFNGQETKAIRDANQAIINASRRLGRSLTEGTLRPAYSRGEEYQVTYI